MSLLNDARNAISCLEEIISKYEDLDKENDKLQSNVNDLEDQISKLQDEVIDLESDLRNAREE